MEQKQQLTARFLLRNLASGRERVFYLPQEPQILKKELEEFAEEYIMLDFICPFDIETECPNLNMVNGWMLEFNEQITNGDYSVVEFKAVMKASKLSLLETVQKIMTLEYNCFDITDDVKGWNCNEEEKAAIWLSKNFPIHAFREAFQETGGIYPLEIEDYIDWEAVWRDYSLMGYVLVDDRENGHLMIINV